jgi:hypothetical protein
MVLPSGMVMVAIVCFAFSWFCLFSIIANIVFMLQASFLAEAMVPAETVPL